MAKHENDLANDIIKLLKTKGWTAWRQNQIPTYKSRRFIGLRGLSDVIAVPNTGPKPRPIWFIEMKSPTGKLREEQERFRDLMIEAGHIHLTVVYMDEFISELESRGQ